ncbi:MAG: thioredoxin domain-containing protein [Campylobacteraceae bacterium]|jgi:protein-disulfide isomerase|nr:thioredoxin domain-containing protein [Campylobacteraceae bacterium]
MSSKKGGEINAKLIILLSLFTVLILFTAGAVYGYKNSGSDKSQSEKAQLEKLLIRENAYIAGSKNAKVTVVEFFDPACPACVAKAPAVARLPELYNSQVRVVYRALAFHNGSDLILSLMEAAKEQGKYKEAAAAFNAYYRNWFVNNQVNAFAAWGVMEKSGADIEGAKNFLDENQAKIDDMLRLNREDAAALGVDATPTFFVNGKKVEQNQLIKEIEDELLKEVKE